MTPRPILKNFPPHCQSLSLGLQPRDNDPTPTDLLSPYTGVLPFSSSRNIPPLDSPHVHFPPTPILTRMGMTHSSCSYDRHPIEVQPNSLALPQRGAREIEEPVEDHGYFPLAAQAVESPSGVKSMLLEPETSFTNTYLAQLTPFERNHSRSLNETEQYTHSSFMLDPSAPSTSVLSANELSASASISISIHFSCLPTQQSLVPNTPHLTRKRDLNDCHFKNGKKTKACRKHSPSKKELRFQDDIMDSGVEDDTEVPSRPSSIGGGYSMGLAHVLTRTKHSMESLIGDSSSVVCGSHFASFRDSGMDGCLGGF